MDSILVLPKKLCTLLSIFICPTNHCTQEAALFSKSFNLYSSCSGHALKMYSVKTGFFFSILHCYILSFFILKDHINVLGVLGSPGTSLQLRLMLGVFSNANDIVIPPQLKYAFRLEKNMSCAMDQNSLTPRVPRVN